MMSERIKNHGLIHILASLINATTIFIVVEAIEVEDQNAIKIDDYGENILPFSLPLVEVVVVVSLPGHKSSAFFRGTFCLTTGVVKR